MSVKLDSFLSKTFERLLDNGARSVLGQNIYHSNIPNEQKVYSMSPEAAILIKKKAFSTLGFNNDLRWMDSTEKLLLRATKALFAYKVQQIKVLESITKYNNYLGKTGEDSLRFLAYILNEASLLNVNIDDYNNNFSEILNSSISKSKSIKMEDISPELADIFDLTKRLAFSQRFHNTTWHIDPSSPENLIVGPGTGVIELTNFNSFSTNISLDSSPSSFSLDMQDPNNLATITDHDIEFAISEAIHGAHGFFEGLLNGSIAAQQYGKVGSISSDLLNYSKKFNDASKQFLNSDEEYIRERLRVFYLGKMIVNPADGVNVFISSNTGLSVGEKSSFSMDIEKESFEISEAVIEAERRLFTSGKMKFEDYKKFRRMSDNSLKMIHVFGGFVSSANSSYSNGSYNFSFTAKDNMGWLSWSNYQKVPALEDLVGVLEDPLTPYKIEVDEFGTIKTDGAPELLDENKELMENEFLSYNSGILKGQQAKEENLYQGQFNGFGSLDKTKILQHPDGFIYRWKSGIISATASLQTANESGSSVRSARLMTQKYGITPADDILSNLDVANIISVLVTGQPYNIDTFMTKSFEAATSRSGGSNQLRPDDPLSFLTQSIKKQNSYYGNFKPYRTVSMNKRTVSRTLRDKIERDNLNSKIVALQKRKVALYGLREDAVNINIEVSTELDKEIAEIDSQISDEISALKRSTYGSFDTDIKFNFLMSGKDDVDDAYENNETVTRAMLHVGAMRRIEDVRMNRDNNYLIVSDQYDYNLELTPFLLRLSQTNYKRFQGDYTSVFDRCVAANSAIGFEFFTNTQGHLEFRPPQWNKTPFSILQQASKARREGKSLIPENIMKLFEKRIDGLKYEIQKYNVLIAMSALLLHRYPDRKLLPGFKGVNGHRSLNFFGVRVGALKSGILKNIKSKASEFASEKKRFGGILSIDFSGDGSNVVFGDVTTLIGEFDAIAQEEGGIFNDIIKSAKKRVQGVEYDSDLSSDISEIATPENLNFIRKQVKNYLGFDPSKDLGLDPNKEIAAEDFPFSKINADAKKTSTSSSMQIFAGILLNEDSGLFRKIQNFVSARDRLVTIHKRNLEKQSELADVNMLFDNPEGFDNELNTKKIPETRLEKALEKINMLSDKLQGSAFEGSVFEHLIEDDRSNILGFGSGKRFVIDDSRIISARFEESPPEFTRINVVGDVPLNIASGLNSATDGLYFWAGASDFDLWRQYGYKAMNMNSVPFLSDAELGCKPYAYFKLQTQRAKILKASVSVVGNEFYQPGDIVYIKSKNLLYYVDSVAHSFSYGGSFTTNLSLSYGHTPGEYLPGPLDVIGQQLSTNPLKDKILVNRNLKSDDNYQTLRPSTILIPPNSDIFGGNTIIGANKETILRFSDNQTRFAKMISDVNLLLTSKKKFLLLRAFISSSPSESPEGSDRVIEAENYLQIVKSMFLDPEFLTRSGNREISLDLGSISDGSFLSDSYENIKSAVSGSLSQAVLPNGNIARGVSEESIILQVCYMKKDKSEESPSGNDNEQAKKGVGSRLKELRKNNRSSSKGELPDLNIKCLNQDLINFLTDTDGSISKDALDVFPKDGPRQESWMDFRLMGRAITSGKTLNFVEVGIIELDLE
jgi:hypothetical protein